MTRLSFSLAAVDCLSPCSRERKGRTLTATRTREEVVVREAADVEVVEEVAVNTGGAATACCCLAACGAGGATFSS